MSQSGQHRTGDHATAARASLPCLDEPITTAMFRLEQVLGLLALSLCTTRSGSAKHTARKNLQFVHYPRVGDQIDHELKDFDFKPQRSSFACDTRT